MEQKFYELIQHADGRSWVRLDGKVISEAGPGHSAVCGVLKRLVGRSRKVIKVNHPNYTRPYEAK